MRLAIALLVTAMVSGTLGMLIAALMCAASKRDDRVGRADSELDRARREHTARALLATYPRPKGHTMSDERNDLELAWSRASRPEPEHQHRPHLPVRQPVTWNGRKVGNALIVAALLAVAFMAGYARGASAGESIAAGAVAETTKAVQTAQTARDAAAYWHDQAAEASETISSLVNELDAAEAAAEAARAATPTVLEQSAPKKPAAPAPKRVTYSTAGVSKWRPLVARYFKAANVTAALSVMRKESGGDPSATNRTTGAAGLFQQMPQYWRARLRKAEAYFNVDLSSDIHDPEANVAVSAWGSKRGSDWSAWSVKP